MTIQNTTNMHLIQPITVVIAYAYWVSGELKWFREERMINYLDNIIERVPEFDIWKESIEEMK